MLKTFWSLAISLFFLFVFFCFPSLLLAQNEGNWTIKHFSADLILRQDTTVEITESITADFGVLQKHGIYRTIPIKYQDRFGNSLNIHFNLLSVTDESNQSIISQKTYEGNNVKLRIGDPNRYVSGINTYLIKYQVKRVLTKPSQNVELYWNVTGNEWPVPIFKATAQVTGLPDGKIQDTICFAGYLGESSRHCQHSHDANMASFATESLNPGENLTIAVAFDPDQFIFPSFWQKMEWFLVDNWIYLTPLFVFLIMFRLYWTRGRDKKYKDIFNESGDIETVPLFAKLDSLMVFGPPKDLSPGEIGTLIDEKVHLRDITAIVIDLARQGFFTIKEIPKKGIFGKTNFELTRKDQDEAELEEFEKSVLDMLFGKSRKDKVELNNLPRSAYKYLEEIKKNLYRHLTQTGYFSSNPKTVRIYYLVAGIIMFSVGAFFLIPFVSVFLGISVSGGVFAGFASGLIVMIFSFFMPARSPKGRKALKEVVGLREWIRLGAWREQIHEKHNFFEEVLPYTIAFGQTSKFINAFKDADIKNLDWYQSTQPIHVANFSHAMDSIGNSLHNGVAATHPRSSASSGGSGFSGGGFSGGGFGGGGGGSW